MEKRKYPRMGIRSLSVDVSDGVGFFPGVVSDVSRVGLGMSDLSKRLNGDVKKMTIVVSARGEHFKMNVQPKWSTQDGPRKSVGVEIMSAPYGWTEFVMNFEPVFHDDVWGEVRLWLDSTEVPPNTVPEPAALFLFGAGLVGLAGFRKKFMNK